MEESKKLSNQKRFKKHLIACAVFTLFAVIFTVLVSTIGVNEVAVKDLSGNTSGETTSLGFSAVNTAIRDMRGYSDEWYKISKYAGYLVFVPTAIFAVIGVYQLFKRRSLKKVDRELLLLVPFYAVVGVVYLIFEKLLVINYCPVLRDGMLKPSYPSSHTLLAMCFCCSAMMVIARLLRKGKAKLAVAINALLTVLMLVTVVGRFLAGVHWLTDIIGGIFISSALLFFFATFLQHEPKTKTE
ncbi:phosphatase PAP2 family protein [Candidatus Saccharibacteria bacterium]|nr:phosphatase PAP2 family protein [Candidatus Saccharibacteria bacterium]